MNRIMLLFCGVVFALAGCVKTKTKLGEVDAYVPIYTSPALAKTIQFSTTPRATVNAGKILALGNLVFQVETGTGIHIINMANPASPAKTGFILVPGCEELQAKGNELYTNNFNDLVVLSSSGGYSVLKRVDNAFPQALNSLPPSTGVYFECPDPAKGIVTGWRLTKVTDPKCRR